MKKEVVEILLVQPYSNGDCLYATAIARQIKKDFPESRLTWAIAPFCQSVLWGNPYVDAVLLLEGLQKNDVVRYRQLRKKFLQEKEAGKWGEVFFTATIAENEALYNGCIRDAVLAAYPHPITEGITPVLRALPEEAKKVTDWVEKTGFLSYPHRILFEFAPQSGQSLLSRTDALQIAEELCKRGDTAVVLSSAHPIESSQVGVLDGSALSFRESVFLTHHCTLLLGTSSGITWGSTSDGGTLLPMVQLLNPDGPWVNALSRDFERHGLPVENVLERFSAPPKEVVQIVQEILEDGFAPARAKWNEKLPLHFKTTERIVYNLLCYGEVAAIRRHIAVNEAAFGRHPAFYRAIARALARMPIKLVRNIFRKKVLPLMRQQS